MKEFKVSNSSSPIEFKIGDDIFKAIPADRVPGNVLIRYSEDVSSGKMYHANTNFFNRVLDKESADLFNARLDSQENPITLETMADVIEWLMEQYSNLTSRASKP